MARDYDFSGWATRNDILCTDGRTIRDNAFADCDGMSVPLVWAHQHDSPENVLGHALLENRPGEGVYTYGYFNDSPAGQSAKEAVRHGDIKYLSIFANRLKQQAGNVLHGVIREVSLVYAGANKGAFIDNAVLEHADGSFDLSDDEAIIFMGKRITPSEGYDDTLEHSDDDEDDDIQIPDVWDSFNDNQKKVVMYLVKRGIVNYLKEQGGSMSHSDYDEYEDSYDEEEIDDSYDEEDGEYLEDEYDDEYVDDGYDEDDEDYDNEYDEYDDGLEHSDYDDNYYEGDDNMYYNVFDTESAPDDTLSHDEMSTIIEDAKRYGSMKESYLAHAEEYGIEQIDWLFPEPKEMNTTPEFIKRPDNWVTAVMNGVHHRPFSRIKSTYADITEDEARARGYLKGRLKKEEVFSLLKRSTTPTTVYKKQKLDRDDTIDITDFDVIAWLKGEMRIMLDEELAGAYLFGDGRIASDDDKISEDHIRPIVSDADLYTIKYGIAPSKTIPAGATTIEDTASYYVKEFIYGAIRARKGYKGSGNPTLFTSESILSEALLLEDTIGHPLYKTEAELATKMRVSRIVTVPDEIMARGKLNNKQVLGVIVNLDDYYVGADQGGAVNMFDDFDIDYNQMKYLIETRCSGALVKPFSAIVLYADDKSGRNSAIVGDGVKMNTLVDKVSD